MVNAGGGGSGVDETEPPVPARAPPFKTAAIFGIKLAITAGCLWYVTRNINFGELSGVARSIDPIWVLCAALALMFQIPLAGLRLRGIVDGLAVPRERTAAGPMIAISMIGLFFAQILPNPGGDAMRTWLLTRLGRTWGRAVIAVLVDRAVGLAVLLVVILGALLIPSTLTELAGNRLLVLAAAGLAIVGGVIGFAVIPYLAPVLDRWRIARPAARVARAVHRVFYPITAGAPIIVVALVIHVLTIVAIWMLARGEGLDLPLPDAAVVFAMIVVLSLLPISISGWGVREVAVTALLQTYGASQAQGLFFSVSFGVLLIIASLPGAIVYALYTPKPVAAHEAVKSI